MMSGQVPFEDMLNVNVDSNPLEKVHESTK